MPMESDRADKMTRMYCHQSNQYLGQEEDFIMEAEAEDEDSEDVETEHNNNNTLQDLMAGNPS